MVDPRHYITILGWMVSELGLSGRDLLCYAIIYGFSQDSQGRYSGNRKYLCDWCGCTPPTIDATLRRLIDRGLIVKESEEKNGVKFNSYRINELSKNFTPYKEILYPLKNFDLKYNECNYIDYNIDNIDNIDHTCYNKEKKENILKEKKSDPLFEECWIVYNRKGSKKKALDEWKKLTESERQIVMPHIRNYVGSREKRYQKDFERYLRDRTFQDVIVKGNETIYDPMRFGDDSEYRPQNDGIFYHWNAERKILYINHNDVENIRDGYDDGNRPDGATVSWNGNVWKWSKEKKEWIKRQ